MSDKTLLFRECLIAARQEVAQLSDLTQSERKRKTMLRAKSLFRGIREDVKRIKMGDKQKRKGRSRRNETALQNRTN